MATLPSIDFANMPGALVSSITCAVGDTIEIAHSTLFKGKEIDVPTTEALRGFRLLYPNLGELSEPSPTNSDTKWNKVLYTHKKYGSQVIEFTEEFTLARSYVAMITVAVHDHASVATGGPAFATYFSESQLQES